MRAVPPPCPEERQLRAWLEHVAQSAIDWLDALDAPTEDLEDDEGGEAVT